MNLGTKTVARARNKQVPKRLAQEIFLHLAHRIARQVFDKDHALRQFMYGKPLCGRILHRLRVKRGPAPPKPLKDKFYQNSLMRTPAGAVIASEAKQSSALAALLDCFVASLLAMTG